MTEPRTISDLYADRDLTPAQVRRLITLLGLTEERKTPSMATPADEITLAATELRSRCRMNHRISDPLADLLDLIVKRHPPRRMLVAGDGKPPEYCGGCQDPPAEPRQWPCAEVGQALKLARAINGTTAETRA